MREETRSAAGSLFFRERKHRSIHDRPSSRRRIEVLNRERGVGLFWRIQSTAGFGNAAYSQSNSKQNTLLLHHVLNTLLGELEGFADALDHESVCDAEVDLLVLLIEDLHVKCVNRNDLTTQQRGGAFHAFNSVRLNGLKEGLEELPLFGEERCAAYGVERGA